MEEAFHIWTMQISNWRMAREHQIAMLDITVKSGIQAFAPSWENLRAYKDGQLSQSEYTMRYYQKVLENSGRCKSDWDDLTKNRSVALACYCRVGEYCHRHLFAPLAIAHLQSLGHRVVFRGELMPQSRMDP